MDSDYETTLKASQLDKMKREWIREGFVEGQKEGAKKELDSFFKWYTKNSHPCSGDIDYMVVEGYIEKRLKELGK